MARDFPRPSLNTMQSNILKILGLSLLITCLGLAGLAAVIILHGNRNARDANTPEAQPDFSATAIRSSEPPRQPEPSPPIQMAQANSAPIEATPHTIPSLPRKRAPIQRFYKNTSLGGGGEGGAGKADSKPGAAQPADQANQSDLPAQANASPLPIEIVSARIEHGPDNYPVARVKLKTPLPANIDKSPYFICVFVKPSGMGKSYRPDTAISGAMTAYGMPGGWVGIWLEFVDGIYLSVSLSDKESWAKLDYNSLEIPLKAPWTPGVTGYENIKYQVRMAFGTGDNPPKMLSGIIETAFQPRSAP